VLEIGVKNGVSKGDETPLSDDSPSLWQGEGGKEDRVSTAKAGKTPSTKSLIN